MGGSSRATPASDSIDANLDVHVKAAQNLAEKARRSAEIQAEEAGNLREALAYGKTRSSSIRRPHERISLTHRAGRVFQISEATGRAEPCRIYQK